MRLLEFSISNFRSIRKIVFQPGALNVLVGPNNSGKSNIADALEFLGDCHRFDPSYAIDIRGGFDRVVHRQREIPRNRSISVSVSIELSNDDLKTLLLSSQRGKKLEGVTDTTLDGSNRTLRINHGFTLQPVREPTSSRSNGRGLVPIASSVIISKEHLTIDLFDNEQVISTLSISRASEIRWRIKGTREILRYCRGPLADQTDEFMKRYVASGIFDETDLILDHVMPWIPGASGILRFLMSIRAYQPQTTACRQSSSPKLRTLLGKFGEDLPSTIESLRRLMPEQLAKIEDHMRTLVPNLKSIVVRTTDELQWVLDFVEGSPPRSWRSTEVSDGTMRSLALFSAVYQPGGDVSIVEEPENTLHPWVIREFVDSCRQFEKERTIVLSTHSPALINTVDPGDIWVVWKEGGGTKLHRLTELSPQIQEDWEEGRFTLFDFLDSGFLPMAVPGGTQ